MFGSHKTLQEIALWGPFKPKRVLVALVGRALNLACGVLLSAICVLAWLGSQKIQHLLSATWMWCLGVPCCWSQCSRPGCHVWFPALRCANAGSKERATACHLCRPACMGGLSTYGAACTKRSTLKTELWDSVRVMLTQNQERPTHLPSATVLKQSSAPPRK